MFFLLGKRCDGFENIENGACKLLVFDVENVMVLGAAVGNAHFRALHKLLYFVELFDVDGVVADEQNGFAVCVDHVFAEHFAVT